MLPAPRAPATRDRGGGFFENALTPWRPSLASRPTRVGRRAWCPSREIRASIPARHALLKSRSDLERWVAWLETPEKPEGQAGKVVHLKKLH